ncbi:MAG: C25 family cysteine peptidase, partial [Calditrichaceae bacterium]
AANIPWRILTLGVPQEGIQSVQILDLTSQSYSDIKIIPVPHPYKDSKGVTNYDYLIDEVKYSESAQQTNSVFKLLNKEIFRDFNVQKLMITPFNYDERNQSLKVYTKIRIQVNFSKSSNLTLYKKRSKFDTYYKDFILNFDVAKNWQLPQYKLGKLAKVTSLPAGPFYRIPVENDGFYKITASTLQNSDISLDNVQIKSIQMFNNSGHILSYKVDDEHYNPPHTIEIPVFVFDQNNNNLFDSNDYILFYGKAVNSWYYDYSTRQFHYQTHPYATKNFYLITFSGMNGKRITSEPLENLSGIPSADYHTKRYHFEDDKYNLLASGPDWYGYRFFGTSGSYSKTMTIDSYNSNYNISEIRVKFKGGSKIDYNPSDKKHYRYYFTLYLNNHLLLNRVNFTDYSYKVYSKGLSDPSHLLEGQNVFNIQYEGDKDACVAYVDWIEISHPATFNASNNYLNLYTNYYDDRNYKISNLSGNEFYLFDVTNPVNPKILIENVTSQNGQVTFDIPADTDLKNLVITSLNSPEINRVESLESYSKKQDLLDPSNQADYIIITHKTFLPYAEEIAELRDHLSTKIVTMEDIYFNFNSTVSDPTAIRNFLKYAFENWQEDKVAFVLFFGDGHYDYRNIVLDDTMRVPPFEIYDETEIDSRTTDNFYVDFGYNGSSFSQIDPELAIGRLPMESIQDAEYMIEKLKDYENNSDKNGWQASITLVGDDEKTGSSSSEWVHQRQSEEIANLNALSKFIVNKIYLSAYESVPGGFGEIKPKANRDLIDAINQGSLIVNYIGHGSPRQWAHESVFNMSRDLNRINNPGRLSFFVAATCDFGKYDDPVDNSFTEALIWKKNAGAIGLLDAVRLVYANSNVEFVKRFYQYLFPIGETSRPLA